MLGRVFRLKAIGTGLFCLAVLGCKKNEYPRVDVHPVRGSVQLQGRPVGGARIVLHPLEETGTDLRPRAVTAADGTFAVTTFEEHDGAPVGRYQVTISWRQPTEKEAELKEEDQDQAPERLPVRYQQPRNSGIEIRVQAGANELEPFKLVP